MRIGFCGIAHVHAGSYLACSVAHEETTVVGYWDHDADRAAPMAGMHRFESREALLEACDAVVIASENNRHLDDLVAAHALEKPALCEKPIVALPEHEKPLQALIDDSARIMVAFPCRYSPAFLRLKARIADIAPIRSINATNRGRCPMDWFVQEQESGGGAMIDHVVHLADLLHILLGEEPNAVTAMKSNLMHQLEVDDCACLQMDFASGIFATLDSSWSRPTNYKTWGDVTMTVVGDKGVLELDMFGQGFESYQVENSKYAQIGYGSNLDAMLFADFVKFCKGQIPNPISAQDGLAAVRVAWKGYANVAVSR